MADGAAISALEAARAEAYATPLEQIDVSNGDRFFDNTMWPFFERLRKEDPVHYCPASEFGPYWSVTKFDDIIAIETNHQVFSSEKNISIGDNDSSDPENPPDDFELPMFIAMDPPKHDEQRKVIAPIVSSENLRNMEPLIRGRAGKILDELPIGETFNWVEKVSIELTTQMLATLFDFPFEERAKLTYWSDLITNPGRPPSKINPGAEMTWDEMKGELLGCAAYFKSLWDLRVTEPPKNDLISMLAHGEATKEMPLFEFLGNILLLIVGGNDTTRNSISGGLLALNEHPDQYDKLRADPSLVESMVPEIIRWQSPVAHMRRTAKEDFEFRGKLIKKGDKVVMWYVSGNRDEDAIPDANRFLIDRARPRQHAAFGFGIHRCVGMRMAEMQLRVVWEEIMRRYPRIDVVGEPVRLKSNFLRSIRELPVRIPARA
ncbi:MAG TPA: cytochrome P450 [Caulobacteraceae bacterium]|nr:cytochrome P450 [Caulobacteraceae bacterium]